jgi:hypothetical protein
MAPKMPWTIRDGPRPGPWEGKDAVGWRWEIERNGETRRMLVEVSGTAMGSANERLPGETVAAKETEGRSAVESILDREDPPGRISLGTRDRTEQPWRGAGWQAPEV